MNTHDVIQKPTRFPITCTSHPQQRHLAVLSAVLGRIDRLDRRSPPAARPRGACWHLRQPSW